jgi:hypothetical protein
METKICKSCNEQKPLDSFCKNKRKKDGLDCYCLDCTRKMRQSPEWKSSHKIAVRNYRKTQGGKRASHKQYLKVKHTIKRKARYFLNNAINAGKLPRVKYLKCAFCSKTAQEYHHHKGYDEVHWLDVIPVCKDCHKKL